MLELLPPSDEGGGTNEVSDGGRDSKYHIHIKT